MFEYEQMSPPPILVSAETAKAAESPLRQLASVQELQSRIRTMQASTFETTSLATLSAFISVLPSGLNQAGCGLLHRRLDGSRDRALGWSLRRGLVVRCRRRPRVQCRSSSRHGHRSQSASQSRVFACSSSARAVAGLTRAKLVATAIRIEVVSDRREVSSRSRLHPSCFSPGDVLDRVRWQLQGNGAIDTALKAPIACLGIEPEAVHAIGNRNQGLWVTAAKEWVHHGPSRVQSRLGHETVVTASIDEGRALRDRQQLIPWGDRESGDARSRGLPWPGRYRRRWLRRSSLSPPRF